MDLRIQNVTEYSGYITFDVILPASINLVMEGQIDPSSEVYLYNDDIRKKIRRGNCIMEIKKEEEVNEIEEGNEETQEDTKVVEITVSAELKKLQKDGASEDAIKDAEGRVQKLTDAYIVKIDDLLAKKEVEIMTV